MGVDEVKGKGTPLCSPQKRAAEAAKPPPSQANAQQG